MEKEIPSLEQEKAFLTEKLSQGFLSAEELQETSKRIEEIISSLEEKEMQWLLLSEKED